MPKPTKTKRMTLHDDEAETATSEADADPAETTAEASDRKRRTSRKWQDDHKATSIKAKAARAQRSREHRAEPTSRRRWRGRRGCRIGRRRRRAGRGSRPRAALPPPVQNPRGDQAPAGHAGPGGQGGTRHQRRRADDLSVARRTLFGADAQYRARRRHQPQDHQFRGSRPPQGGRGGTRSAGRHGRDFAHRRREPHQDRDQARFRISAADVGDGPRPDPEIHRAETRLRGRLAGQAIDPRSLFQRNRRRDRRRRPRPITRPRTSCACSCRAMPRT